jgi:GT2 family glycosyltransferase
MSRSGPVAVVVITRNRGPELLASLARLRDLPERPPVVVVDNASTDGTLEAVRRTHPWARVVPLDRNAGAAGRNVGVSLAATPYVAFSDDDSWWRPGALGRAAAVLDGHPRLGLLAGRILVGPDERLDPICRVMAASPLDARGLPGPAVLGFVACAAVVRREAFLEAGGFEERFGVGGEETLLALDMVRLGWRLAYVEEVVAHHHPSPVRDRAARRRRVTRNRLLVPWLRRPIPVALSRTAGTVLRGAADPAVRRGVADAIASMPWALRRRAPISRDLERAVRLLERDAGAV